jgi:hypothetical protein
MSRSLVNLMGKLANKGSYCIFIEYEDNSPQDAYRVLDLKNLIFMIRRDSM